MGYTISGTIVWIAPGNTLPSPFPDSVTVTAVNASGTYTTTSNPSSGVFQFSQSFTGDTVVSVSYDKTYEGYYISFLNDSFTVNSTNSQSIVFVGIPQSTNPQPNNPSFIDIIQLQNEDGTPFMQGATVYYTQNGVMKNVQIPSGTSSTSITLYSNDHIFVKSQNFTFQPAPSAIGNISGSLFFTLGPGTVTFNAVPNSETIIVKLTDQSGNPLSGTINDMSGGGQMATVQTDSSGTATITASYGDTISVSSPDYTFSPVPSSNIQVKNNTAIVLGGGTIQFVGTPVSETITVTVVDTNGNPIAGATITY